MTLKPMYPHEVDRLRVFYILYMKEVETLTERLGIPEIPTQQTLAARSGVAQSVISNLESLEKNAAKKPKRKTLLKVLTKGLKLNRKDTDTFLWLYDGQPIRDAFEAEEYFEETSCTEEIKYDEKSLRSNVLDLLEKAVKHFSPERPIKREVEIVFKTKGWPQLEGLRKIQKIEQGPGQRLVIPTFPSRLTHPSSNFQNLKPDPDVSEEEQEEYRKIGEERRSKFRENLPLYGERHIYAIKSLQKYLSDDSDLSECLFTLEQRQKHVKHVIELLCEFNYFEVGLINESLELELLVKSMKSAIIQGPEGKAHWSKDRMWGPRYIFFHDREIVLPFFLNFERQWDNILEENRTKSSVIKKLEQLLDCSKSANRK